MTFNFKIFILEMRRWRPKWYKKERLGDLPRFHILGSFPVELRPTNIEMEDVRFVGYSQEI